MPKLINHTDNDMKANTGHIIPANGSLSVTVDTFNRICQDRFLGGQFKRRNLTTENPPSEEMFAGVSFSEPGDIHHGEEVEFVALARSEPNFKMMKKADLIQYILDNSQPDQFDVKDLEKMRVTDTDDEDGLMTLAASIVVLP